VEQVTMDTPKDFAPLIEMKLDERGCLIVSATSGECRCAFASAGFSAEAFVDGFAEMRDMLWSITQAQVVHPVIDAIAAMRTGAPYIGADRH
jgi:hypothetical protein